MSGVNKAILIGNLGADPELRFTNGGEPILNFRIAVTETWRDKGGDKKERTEWLTCVLWGKRGEVLAPFLSKGSRVYVEGKIQTRKWQDKEGNDRYSTEIRVDNVELLGGGKRDGGERAERQSSGRGNGGGSRDNSGADYPDDFGDDSIPFSERDGRLP